MKKKMDYEHKYWKYEAKYLKLKKMVGGKKDELIIVNKKDNDKIKKQFSRLCECVRWNLYNDPRQAYDNGKKISEKKLNSVILPETIRDKILIVPVSRFEEITDYIILRKNEITYWNCLRH